MSKFDDLLNEVADKLDHAASVIEDELVKLKEQIAAGQPTDETIARLQSVAERIHTIVDHDIVEDNENEDDSLDPEDHELVEEESPE